MWARYCFSFVILSISMFDGIVSVNVRFVNTSRVAALRTFSFLVFIVTKRWSVIRKFHVSFKAFCLDSLG